MDAILALLGDPAAWAALIALVVMEVVLGIDNLVFISILSNKLPEEQRSTARKIGISLALIMRLALLSTLAFLVGLTQPVCSLPFQGPPDPVSGHPMFELAFSWRDLILIAGGLFLDLPEQSVLPGRGRGRPKNNPPQAGNRDHRLLPVP